MSKAQPACFAARPQKLPKHTSLWGTRTLPSPPHLSGGADHEEEDGGGKENGPSRSGQVDDTLDMLISQAHIWRTLFEQSPEHLKI